MDKICKPGRNHPAAPRIQYLWNAIERNDHGSENNKYFQRQQSGRRAGGGMWLLPERPEV